MNEEKQFTQQPARHDIDDRPKIKSRKHLERLAKRQIKNARVQMINQEVGEFGRVIINRLKRWRFLFFVSVFINLCLVVAVIKGGLL